MNSRGSSDIHQLGNHRPRLVGALSGRSICWSGAFGRLGLKAGAEYSHT